MNRVIRVVVIAALSTVIMACSSSDGDDDTAGVDIPLIDETVVDTGVDADAGVDTILSPLFDVIVDPAPEFTELGSFSCDGCPDSNITDFSISTPDTSFVSSGSVTNTDGNGTYTILADDGSAIEGEIATDDNGNFSTTLPLFCGTQTIKYIWSNEVGRYVLVTEAIRTDCTSADIQLTLSWDNLGIDFELHLVEQGGRINNAETDCTWNTCVSTQPDWGVVGDTSDNPVKDVDDTGNFGPENIP